jgi:hypothetical protein
VEGRGAIVGARPPRPAVFPSTCHGMGGWSALKFGLWCSRPSAFILLKRKNFDCGATIADVEQFIAISEIPAGASVKPGPGGARRPQCRIWQAADQSARGRSQHAPGHDGKHRLIIEAYDYRWYRVGGLDCLLRRMEIDQPMKTERT